jgi:hypothetical protein
MAKTFSLVRSKLLVLTESVGVAGDTRLPPSCSARAPAGYGDVFFLLR